MRITNGREQKPPPSFTLLSFKTRISSSLFCYYIKQIGYIKPFWGSTLPCVCSVIDHRWRQNVVRTKKWHTRRGRVCHRCSYHILTSSVIYYWTDARQYGIYLLDIFPQAKLDREINAHFLLNEDGDLYFYFIISMRTVSSITEKKFWRIYGYLFGKWKKLRWVIKRAEQRMSKLCFLYKG